MKPISTSIIGLTTLVAGFVGGQVIDSAQVETLNAQVETLNAQVAGVMADNATLVKENQETTDSYVYSQLTSGRLPDVSVSDALSISQAYINELKRQGITIDFNTQSVDDVIKKGLRSRGELLTCTP